MKGFFFVIALLFSCLLSFAQEKNNLKFGDITPKDFEPKVYAIDSNANAVVIADIGSSAIEGNTKNWFSLSFKHYKRVHILNKNGYDVANVSIQLYTNGTDEEQLDRLRAVTYNLENGKVIETKLDIKASVFKDKINKNLVVKKFTFPNLKEGSIIEYEYTIISDFLENLQPWEFQGAYPRLWSEYKLMLPDFLGYVFLSQGYRSFDINESKASRGQFNISDSRGAGATDYNSFTSGVTDSRWVIKNVPALKEENYTTALDNHISKIEFQLSEYRSPLTYHNFMGTWPKLADDLMKSEYFGEQLTKDNGWMNDISRPLVKDVPGYLDRAKKIYSYIRDNYTCTEHSGKFLDQKLKDIARTKSGKVSEINLLLTALLKHENIEADPVILSTRSHGYTYALYPILERFNYVVCRVVINDKAYFLDATEPHLGFGYLPLRCYNGHARIITDQAIPIELAADSITERKVSTIFIINDEKGNMVGSMSQEPGYYESLELRNRIKEKGQDQLMKDIKKGFGGTEIEISNAHIDSLDQYDYDLGIHYDFDIKDEKEDIIYMNPMFGEGYKENLFKSSVRLYPVEMPFAMDETFNLQLEVPIGYVTDELPKGMVVKLNEQGDGVFEYRVSQSGDNISLRSRIRFLRAYFMPDEYENLREFFNLVVKKQSEQIVFKKKK